MASNLIAMASNLIISDLIVSNCRNSFLAIVRFSDQSVRLGLWILDGSESYRRRLRVLQFICEGRDGRDFGRLSLRMFDCFIEACIVWS